MSMTIGSITLPKAYVTGDSQETLVSHDLTLETLHIGKRAMFRVKELVIEGKKRFSISKIENPKNIFGLPVGAIKFTIEPCNKQTVESAKRFEELVDKGMIMWMENGKITQSPKAPGKGGEKCGFLFMNTNFMEPLNPTSNAALHNPIEADSPQTLKKYSHLFNKDASAKEIASREEERKADFEDIAVPAQPVPAAPLKPLAARAAAAKPQVQTQKLPLASHNLNSSTAA